MFYVVYNEHAARLYEDSVCRMTFINYLAESPPDSDEQTFPTLEQAKRFFFELIHEEAEKNLRTLKEKENEHQ